MKIQVITGAILLTMVGMVQAQQNQAVDDRYDNRPARVTDSRRYDEEQRRDDERRLDDRRRDDEQRQRTDDRRRQEQYRSYDSRSNDYRNDDSRFDMNRNTMSQTDSRALRQAYEEGLLDGQRRTEDRIREEKRNDYKNVTFGVYVGANSTRFKGEDVNGNDLSGRAGYQAGFFLRAGGRLFGQIGAEYFASSSNFFRPKDGQNLTDITGQIDQKYLHIPAYIGVKLAQSHRGISSVRLQVGAEYANTISNSNTVNINSSEIKSGSFNALGQLGFDIGPLFIDLTYHHGLENVITNYASSERRIGSVNVGFKF